MGCKKGVRKSETHRKRIGDAQREIPKGPSPHRMTVKEMKARIRSFWGNTYDLSLIVSDLPSEYLTLVCKVHGPFEKRRQDVLHKKTGCPGCVGGLALTTKQFIAKAKLKQPSHIGFRKTVYVNSKTSVVVTCKVHGDFEVSPMKVLHAREAFACKDCNARRIFDKRVASGQYPDPENLAEYRDYRTVVRRLSNKAAKALRGKRNPNKHLDHVFSIKEGFLSGVRPEVIGHITNLRLLSGEANRRKSHSCGKTLKQLFKDYEDYERKNRPRVYTD